MVFKETTNSVITVSRLCLLPHERSSRPLEDQVGAIGLDDARAIVERHVEVTLTSVFACCGQDTVVPGRQASIFAGDDSWQEETAALRVAARPCFAPQELAFYLFRARCVPRCRSDSLDQSDMLYCSSLMPK